MFKIKRTSQLKKGDDTIINIYMGSKCNLKCKYCYEEKNIISDVQKDDIHRMISDVNSIINKSEKVSIELCGREVTLYLDEYSKVLESIENKDRVVHIGLITNGYNINSKFIEFVNKFNISSVTISIDIGRTSHNKNRVTIDGKPTYDKILDNILKIKQDTLARICINSVYDPRNKPSYFEFKELVNYIINNRITRSYKISFLNDLDDDKIEDIEYIFDMVLSIYKYLLKNNRHDFFIRIGSGFDITRLDEYLNESNFKIDCNARRTATISPNKKSYSCLLALSDPEKYKNKKLFEIDNINSAEIGSKLILEISKNFTCQTCYIRSFCRGACPILYLNNGTDVCINKRKNHAKLSIKYLVLLMDLDGFKEYLKNICECINKIDSIYNKFEEFKDLIEEKYNVMKTEV